MDQKRKMSLRDYFQSELNLFDRTPCSTVIQRNPSMSHRLIAVGPETITVVAVSQLSNPLMPCFLHKTAMNVL